MKHYTLIILLLTPLSMALAQSSENGAWIFGEVYSIQPKENIRISLWNDAFKMANSEHPALNSIIPLNPPSIYAGTISQRSRDFNLEIPPNMLPAWIVFEDTLSGFSYGPYLISPSDSIKIKFDQIKQQVIFAGPARQSFEMSLGLSQLLERKLFEIPSMLDFSAQPSPRQELLDRFEANNKRFRRKVIPILTPRERLKKMNQTLPILKEDEFALIEEFYRNRVPETVYNTLINDFISHVYFRIFYGFHGYFFRDLKQSAPELVDIFAQSFSYLENQVDSLASKYPPLISPNYLKMQEYRMLGRAAIDDKSVYEVSHLEEDPDLREAVLTAHFLKRNVIIREGISDLGKFLVEVQNPIFKERLETWYTASTPGLLVPDHAFKDEEGTDIRITDFKGKILLLNIWLTGCSSCRSFNEYHLTKIVQEYQNDPEVSIISLSLDQNRERWLRSKASGHYSPEESIHIWTGYEGNSTEHPYLKYFNITSAPQLQLIDQDGKLTGLGLDDKTYEGIRSEIEKLKNHIKNQPNKTLSK